MANINFKNSPIETTGDLPVVGLSCPPVSLTNTDLSQTDLSEFLGKKVVLNIFPSIDTVFARRVHVNSTKEHLKWMAL